MLLISVMHGKCHMHPLLHAVIPEAITGVEYAMYNFLILLLLSYAKYSPWYFSQTFWIHVLPSKWEIQFIIYIKQYLKLLLYKAYMYLYTITRPLFVLYFYMWTIPWVVSSVILHTSQCHLSSPTWNASGAHARQNVPTKHCNKMLSVIFHFTRMLQLNFSYGRTVWLQTLLTVFIWMTTSRTQCWVNQVEDGNMDAANLPCNNQLRTTSMECKCWPKTDGYLYRSMAWNWREYCARDYISCGISGCLLSMGSPFAIKIIKK